MHDPPACGHALLQFIPRLCGSTQRYSPHVLFAGDMWKARSPTHVDIHRVTILPTPSSPWADDLPVKTEDNGQGNRTVCVSAGYL